MLGRIFPNFPERDSDEGDKVDRIRGYLIALEGVSLRVLCEAERRILRAEVEGFEPRFMPTPPQLAKLCRTILAEWRWAETPKPVALLERFDAPADPAIVTKCGTLIATLATVVDIERHETRAEWLARMGSRVKLLEHAP